MLSTTVVSTRSKTVVMRPSISSGLRPVYCQATAMTGILISGKISVGVRRITTGARIRISSATTINVYGRLRASRTIHILVKAVAHARPAAERAKHRDWAQSAGCESRQHVRVDVV